MSQSLTAQIAAPDQAPNHAPVSAVPNRVVFVLSLVGLLVAGYLWYAHATGAHVPCSFRVASGCDKVAQSPYSKFPVGSAVPVAAYGALGYLLLTGLAVVRTLGGDFGGARDRRLLSVMALIALGGLLFSLRLTYLSITVIRAECIWCLASQALIAGVFVMSVIELFRQRRERFRDFSEADAPLAGASSAAASAPLGPTTS